MYSYTHDPESGGLLLNDQPAQFSKEPRPVYASELVLLGFDEFWNFERQDNIPYMWAEANYYWYRGKRVARINGGNLYRKPQLFLEQNDNGEELLAKGITLMPVDIELMVHKNTPLLDVLQMMSEKRIIEYYEKYLNKVDCFYVAFSGGKDSIVLLDLVQRALPENSFVVLFGDTDMEFPDTYDLVAQVEEACAARNIPFYKAKSHLEPEKSWRRFGPPAKTLRWCCSVHKSTPQTLKLREITAKKDCIGMAFVGVREHESLARSAYKVFNYGKKQKGQYSLNPILEWSSAEVWLYIYSKKLHVNNAYTKGNSRVGCICCPSTADSNASWFRRINYTDEYDKYISIVKDCFSNEIDKKLYINDSLWTTRYSGRDLAFKLNKHEEIYSDNTYTIRIKKFNNNWNEWVKTIYQLSAQYKTMETNENLEIIVNTQLVDSSVRKLIKIVALKSVYCIGCKACEANCQQGSLLFNGIKPTITDCTHCAVCHSIDNGCLLVRSLRNPKQDKMKIKNINIFEDYTISNEWFTDLFYKKYKYFDDNSLGPNQLKIFKRILKYAEMFDKSLKVTPFFEKIAVSDFDHLLRWQLILVNSAINNPQINWYIKNLPIDRPTTSDELNYKLEAISVSKRSINAIIKTFARICNLQFGTILKFGTYNKDGEQIISVQRTKPSSPDPRVLLYGLYKFAEACGGFYEITLGRLMDFEMESKGISPAEIFALSRDEMSQYLRGLAQNYPDFVTNFASTHGLEVLNLNPDKTSTDVLELF